MAPEEYLKDRIDDQINWYNTKSGINKKYHYLTKILIIIFSAIIPFATGIQTEYPVLINYLVGLLGVLIVILTGIATQYKFQEKWNTYRKTSEILTHEKFLFQTKSGAYAKHKDPFRLFVFRSENIMSEELSTWSTYINEDEQ